MLRDRHRAVFFIFGLSPPLRHQRRNLEGPRRNLDRRPAPDGQPKAPFARIAARRAPMFARISIGKK
jgi:hypothetical protein